MHGYLKLCNAVYWLALILWISSLISAGVAAMNVFPTMDSMPLQLEQYAAYPQQAHPRLAAGKIMDGVFFVVDMLQFVAIPFLGIMLILQFTVFRMPLKRLSNVIRTTCIVAAALLFAFHATMLAPKMNRELRAYWTAAEAGMIDEARQHRHAFNQKHPTADLALRVDLLLLVIAAATSAAALGPSSTGSASQLQEPSLLKTS